MKTNIEFQSATRLHFPRKSEEKKGRRRKEERGTSRREEKQPARTQTVRNSTGNRRLGLLFLLPDKKKRRDIVDIRAHQTRPHRLTLLVVDEVENGNANV